MLNSIRNFSKTIYAKILLFIVVIPFVFWGMGGVFNSGNTNSLVKINEENVSTQDFIKHITEQKFNQEVIRENIDNNIVEELLSELISKKIPKIRQTLFFSATLSKEILKIGKKFVINPKLVEVSPPSSPSVSIDQSIVKCNSKFHPEVDHHRSLFHPILRYTYFAHIP